MNDKKNIPPGPVGSQIRRMRLSKGWSLTELAKRAGTSAPALHRYESGWDGFKMITLRKIASALEMNLEVRLVNKEIPPPIKKTGPSKLLPILDSLFWDKCVTAEDLEKYPAWVLCRTLMFGDLRQVRAALVYFGGDLLKETLELRTMDKKTRNFWRLMLKENEDAPQSSQC
jgi:transcriptional regulator with XRE-family HTH domain